MLTKSTKGYTRRVSAALVLTVLLAGCGAAPQATATPTLQPTAKATKAPQPKVGGTIHLSMPTTKTADNPLKVTSREMSSIYGLIFESLLRSDSAAPAAQLAELPTVSPDNLQLTFKLREGVKWQGSGRALDAQDVLYTLNQIKALGDQSTYAYVMNWLEPDSWQEGAGGTVVVRLKKPFYGAWKAFGFPILPRDGGFDDGAMPAMPYGTGPYLCTEFQPGTSIKLTVNPDWWMKTPYIQYIEVLPFANNATAIKSLVLRQLDAVQTNDLTVGQYRDSGDANVYEYPTHEFDYLAVNFASADLKDKRIRQAIAYAIDRREIAAWAFSNHAIVADTPVPPDSWLYDGKVVHYNKDIKKAEDLIASAGWKRAQDNDELWGTSPDGVNRPLKIRILTNREESDTLRVDSARLIADQLKAVGIDAEVNIQDWDKYLTMLQEGNYDLALCGAYLSPVPDLSFLLRSDGALNTGHWGSDKMDEMLDKIVQSADSKELSLRMAELQSAIIEELPVISLYFRTHSLLTSPNLQGISGVREEAAYADLSQWFLP